MGGKERRNEEVGRGYGGFRQGKSEGRENERLSKSLCGFSAYILF